MQTTTSTKLKDERGAPDGDFLRASAPAGASETGLLVSVRNLAECELVLNSPTPWVDLKEPRHGSLGRPEAQLALDVYHRIQRYNSQSPASSERYFSVALGEWGESCGDELTRYIALLGPRVFFKIALAGCGNHSSSSHNVREAGGSEYSPDWKQRMRDWVFTLPSPGQIILCYYADQQLARCPSWEDLVELSSELGCRYVLVDTFSKNGKRLMDWCPEERLANMIQFANGFQLRVAVAGSLRLDDFMSLIPLGVAWIGVRGAVCEESLRTSSLCEQRLVDANAVLGESHFRLKDFSHPSGGASHVLR